METLYIFLPLCWGGNPLIDSHHKGRVMQILMVPWSLTWTSCWTNYWVAGDLRCHDSHVCDVTACVLQDVAVEATFPRSAICQLWDSTVKSIEYVIAALKDGSLYHEDRGLYLRCGSQAEGLAFNDYWGHGATDKDLMLLHGGRLGVHIAAGQNPREESCESCLDLHTESCPPGYSKLHITKLSELRESRLFGDEWFDDKCVDQFGILNTYNTLQMMKDSNKSTRDDTISGPASQSGAFDTVPTFVCSGPHPDLHHEFRHRPRGPWPHKSLINLILQLPMLLVLVGHKPSPEFRSQARMSFSHLEYKLIKELPENIRQGFIACKYVIKHFLKVHRGQNETDDGRSLVGSYHIKTALLRFVEQMPKPLITSPFQLFLDLLLQLDECLRVGKLPHYFIAQCNLLETVGDDERHLARLAIREILADPLNALLTSPSNPQQIYGKVRQDELAVAFQRVSAHPTCEQSRKDLSELLACVDERRRQRFTEQRKSDGKRVSGRAALTGLVDTLKAMKHV